jgi:hypothetical protein
VPALKPGPRSQSTGRGGLPHIVAGQPRGPRPGGPVQRGKRPVELWRGARRARWRLAGGKVLPMSLRGAQGGCQARGSVTELTRAVVRRGGGGELQAAAVNGEETALVTGGNGGVALQYQGGRGKVRCMTIGSNNTRRSGSLRR